MAQGGGTTTVISLEAVRQEAGARWEKLRETIYARLEALLRLRLAPTDFFLPIDDVSYLVSMPKAAPEDAQVCCLRIAYELHTSLLGPCSISQLQIANAFSIGDDLLELTPIVSHQLVRLAERADIMQLLKPQDGTPAPMPHMPKSAAPAPAKDTTPYHFLPVWDVNKEVIWAYRCKPAASTSMLTSDSPRARAQELIRVANATLSRAALSLEEHLVRGERFLLSVPVSYETLAAPIARMEFVATCRQLPCELRPYMVFEIANMPIGVPHSRLLDFVASLQSFCRGVTAQIAIHGPQQSIYEGTGLIGLGFELPAGAPALPMLDTDRLCMVTKRLGISAFVDNVSTPDALNAAIKAGVSWISGPVVSAPLTEPKPMSRLRKETVLQNAGPLLRASASGQSW